MNKKLSQAVTEDFLFYNNIKAGRVGTSGALKDVRKSCEALPVFSFEKWKAIKGYDGLYSISSIGNVYSIRQKKIMKTTLQEGYRKITLRKNRFPSSYRVHRLVAQAFIPNPNSKPQINHKDFNKANNNVENLEWVTPRENTFHSIKNHGGFVKGHIPTNRKLKPKDIPIIRSLNLGGLSRIKIAKLFFVSSGTIASIILGKSWRNA